MSHRAKHLRRNWVAERLAKFKQPPAPLRRKRQHRVLDVIIWLGLSR